MARWQAAAALVAVLLVGSACTGQPEPKPRLAKASPGRYVTVAGAGLNPEAPGAIDAPVDLADAPGGDGLLFLGEHGTVYRIGTDGKVTEYARGPGATDKRWPLIARSMAVRPDGKILTAVTGEEDKVLAVYELAPGEQPREVGEFGKPKEAGSVHLVSAPDESVLLLKDGTFVEGEPFGNIDLPRGMNKIITAVADEDRLLIARRDELAWIRNGKVEDRIRLRDSISNMSRVTIATNGKEGAYIGGSVAFVHRARPDGIRSTILLGQFPDELGCGDDPRPGGRSGQVEEPAWMGTSWALHVIGDQIYIADQGCRRILAIGLPSGEFTPPAK